VPDVELPPKTPFTNQSTFVVVAPVTVAVNACVLAAPEVTTHGVSVHVGEIVTCGGGRIVAAEVADNFLILEGTAPTLTIAGDGTVAGARYKTV